jgi:hypothetical protein
MAGQKNRGTGPRPHTWKSGPDPELHNKFRVFGQCRNQAQFRGEDWQLTFEQFVQLWSNYWQQRGRTVNSLCMTRRDWTRPWTMSNTQIITRQAHAQAQADGRKRARNHLGQLIRS